MPDLEPFIKAFLKPLSPGKCSISSYILKEQGLAQSALTYSGCPSCSIASEPRNASRWMITMGEKDADWLEQSIMLFRRTGWWRYYPTAIRAAAYLDVLLSVRTLLFL